MKKNLALILLSALMLVTASTSTASAAPGSEMVYISFNLDLETGSMGFNIESSDFNGGNKHTYVTTGAAPFTDMVLEPKYSKTGNMVGFTNATDTDGNESQIYISFNGGAPELIMNNSILHDFSPDGKSILYTRPDKDGHWYLYSYDLTSKKETLIYNKRDINSAAWSRKGDKIAISANFESTNPRLKNKIFGDILVINADGSGEIRVTNTSDETEDTPQFNEDGSRVYFLRELSVDEFMFEYADASGKDKSATAVMELESYDISDKGDKLIYNAGDKIYVSNLDGSNKKEVGQDMTCPVWKE